MVVTLKGLSKNGKVAFYSGAIQVVRLQVALFGGTAPQSLDIEGLAPAKQPKAKMTPEERKAARAAKPKPTKAEKAAQLRERAAKLEAEAAAAEQPSL